MTTPPPHSGFPYVDMLPEMKDEVRARCTVLTQRLLAMTCKAEQAKRVKLPEEDGFPRLIALAGDAHLMACITGSLTPHRADAWHADILHAAIGARQWSFVVALLEADIPGCCNVCGKCLWSAVVANCPSVVLLRQLKVHCQEDAHDAHELRNDLLSTAVRMNNVDMLERLKQVGLIEAGHYTHIAGIGMLQHELYDAKTLPFPWLDRLAPLHWLREHKFHSIFNDGFIWLALLKDMIHRQWPLDRIEAQCTELDYDQRVVKVGSAFWPERWIQFMKHWALAYHNNAVLTALLVL